MSTFPLNFTDLYEININPSGTAVWERLAKGLTSGTVANNDVVDQTPYLDGDGYGSSTVTGGQLTVAFSGHRVIGDDAQDFIEDISNTFGGNRETQFRKRNAQGKGFSANVTVANIQIGGGDANAKQDISFEIHCNGKPTELPLSVASELSIVIAGGTLAGTTKATATAGEGNTLGYKLTASAPSAYYNMQYIDDYIGYTSASDITASVGQFLTVFELDANQRLVKVNTHELVLLDIT